MFMIEPEMGASAAFTHHVTLSAPGPLERLASGPTS